MWVPPIRTMIVVESLLAGALLTFFASGDNRQIAVSAMAGSTASMPWPYYFLAALFFAMNLPVTIPMLFIDGGIGALVGFSGWHAVVAETIAIWAISIVFWTVVICIIRGVTGANKKRAERGAAHDG